MMDLYLLYMMLNLLQNRVLTGMSVCKHEYLYFNLIFDK